MIKTDKFKIDGKKFIKTYSDTYKIKQVETGIIYDYAIDVVPCKFTYEESDEFLPVEEGLPAEKDLNIVEDTKE